MLTVCAERRRCHNYSDRDPLNFASYGCSVGSVDSWNSCENETVTLRIFLPVAQCVMVLVKESQSYFSASVPSREGVNAWQYGDKVLIASIVGEFITLVQLLKIVAPF